MKIVRGVGCGTTAVYHAKNLARATSGEARDQRHVTHACAHDGKGRQCTCTSQVCYTRHYCALKSGYAAHALRQRLCHAHSALLQCIS
ncbi:hypothetical protein HAX54_023922, partial [Datura stramonium]|nr:hypothetical protein [Datura stramonium]